MKSKKFKVYVDGKLRLVCGNEFVLMNNVVRLTEKYGKDRVAVKEYEVDMNLNKVELQNLKDIINGIKF